MSDSLLTEVPSFIDIKNVEALVGVIDDVFHSKINSKHDKPMIRWAMWITTQRWPKTDEEIADEIKAKLKRCARILLDNGFEITKESGDNTYYLIGKRDNIEISFLTSSAYTCKMVPVTDDNGEPVMETKKVVSKVIEEEVTDVKMEKVCAPLFSAREWENFE